MDSTDDCLSSLRVSESRVCRRTANLVTHLCQLPHEPDNIERGLAIKSRSRLVQKEQRGLCDKLDCKGEALTLLDGQAAARNYNRSVRFISVAGQ